MKITDIQAIPIYIPLKEKGPISTNGKSSAYHVLIKVFTDEGVIGYGEAWRLTPGAVAKYVEEALKPHLIGQNPMHVERLWNLMYEITFRYGRKGIALHAISGIEVALWDIVGKCRNLPVYEMIGGLCRDKIKAYASLPHYPTPREAAEVAVRCVEEGYTAIKLHQKDIEAVKATREAIGPNITLMLDVNGAWNPRQAVEMAKRLEEYNLYWLEEPVAPMDDYEGLAYVRENSKILITAGENEYTHYGFREMIIKRAVDIIQPDVIKSGGIMPLRKIFALAEAWNLQIATHSWYFGPGVAATIHLCLSNPRSEWIEINAIPLETYFSDPPMRPENGYITIPPKPGLGIGIREEIIKRHSYVHQ